MPEKQELVCDGCQKTLRIPEKYWGKKVRCPQCSEVLSIPASPPAAEVTVLDDVEFVEEDDDPFVDDLYSDQDEYGDLPAAPPRRAPASGRKKKKKKSEESGGGAFGTEKSMLNSGVLGGLGLMLGAAVWLVLGLVLADRIFIYPPFMFLFGMVAVIKGIIRGE